MRRVRTGAREMLKTMRPYITIRLSQYPDTVDIQREGRQTSVGRFYNRSGQRGLRAIQKSAKKRVIRRALKRHDRARSLRSELQLEEEVTWLEFQEFFEEEAHFHEEYDDTYWSNLGHGPLCGLTPGEHTSVYDPFDDDWPY